MLTLHPDGGVARLRARPSGARPALLTGTVDLAAR